MLFLPIMYIIVMSFIVYKMKVVDELQDFSYFYDNEYSEGVGTY